MDQENKFYETDGDFTKGLMWATAMSVPLWISFFGWMKMVMNLHF